MLQPGWHVLARGEPVPGARRALTVMPSIVNAPDDIIPSRPDVIPSRPDVIFSRPDVILSRPDVIPGLLNIAVPLPRLDRRTVRGTYTNIARQQAPGQTGG